MFSSTIYAIHFRPLLTLSMPNMGEIVFLYEVGEDFSVAILRNVEFKMCFIRMTVWAKFSSN